MSFSSTFNAAWWLRNPHAQTMWPTLFRLPTPMNEKWERVETPDGDFVDLVWDEETYRDSTKSTVILFLGFEGGITSSYAKGLMKALARKNLRPVLMHYRGCSGVPNRFPKGYHCGETKDIILMVNYLKEKNPGIPIGAIGISLGGNALLKWLGESGSESGLSAAVSVSVPFQLDAVANRLMHGLSRIYQTWLIRAVTQRMKKKFQVIPCPFDIQILDQVKTFWEFDEKIIAPLHGFKNVHEYYRLASCRPYLQSIKTPTLIIHAKDDPFMSPEFIPNKSEYSSSCILEISERGGHVGFLSGSLPGFPTYWLEDKIPEFLCDALGATT